MLKIKVACFFLGHGVYHSVLNKDFHIIYDHWTWVLCLLTAGDQGVIIGLAVGLGVPLFILAVIVCLLICCILLRDRPLDSKPVEAINRFFPFPSKTLRSAGGTLRSTTNSYCTQKDVEPVYDTPTIDRQPDKDEPAPQSDLSPV